ncbi:MAG: PfkB family carbohydrate kinase, partial [Armatimonadota bacterium]
MSKVLVVGSSNYDLCWSCSSLPLKGQTVGGTSFATFMGGKGANQAVAAARIGASVAFCGSVGSDSFGDQMLEGISGAGADVSFVKRSPLPSGTASVVVESSGANQIVVALGANMDLNPDDVRAAIEKFEPDYILAQLEVPLEA